jgi:hypothetical protein
MQNGIKEKGKAGRLRHETPFLRGRLLSTPPHYHPGDRTLTSGQVGAQLTDSF